MKEKSEKSLNVGIKNFVTNEKIAVQIIKHVKKQHNN